MFLKCCLTTAITNVNIGNEFQADGAEPAKAVSKSETGLLQK